MLVDGDRQGGGKEPSVMQAMKQKLEKMLRNVEKLLTFVKVLAGRC